MTVRATWNGSVLAESDQTVVVEGNHYFPPSSVRRELFSPTTTQTSCPWKGIASYLTITVGGQSLPDGAWYYPQPYSAAQEIKNHIAFYSGVQVTSA